MLGRTGNWNERSPAQAVGLGWAEQSIFRDTVLDSLRGDPEFEAIVAEVKERIGDE